MKRPKGYRKGQNIFNFLEYLTQQGVHTNQNLRMADPFHLSDEEWDAHYEAYLKDCG